MVRGLPDDAQPVHSRCCGQFYRMKDSYDDMNFTAPYLATINAPTLIIHGDGMNSLR
jgi:hypothetical protein